MTGTLNNKAYVLHQPQEEDSTSSGPNEQQPSQHPMDKLFASVLCSPGQIVSFSLMIRTAEEMALLEVGQINAYKIQGNNTKVC